MVLLFDVVLLCDVVLLFDVLGSVCGVYCVF